MTQLLRQRLPMLDPRAARLQTALLGALNGAETTAIRLHAAVYPARPPAVIACATDAGPIELAPLRVDGAIPLLTGDDGSPDAVAALDALDRLEPLVAAIERVLGVALLPVDVARPTLTGWLRVEQASGAATDAVALAVASCTPASAPGAPSRSVVDPGFAALPVRWRIAVDGPRLPPARIDTLVAGAVVLIGRRPVAELHAAANAWPAVLDSDSRQLVITPSRSLPMTAADPGLDAALLLPLTIEVDGGTMRLGELAALVDGSVVPLPADGATLPVTLTINGARVARGELVALGETYGVLITQRLIGAD